METAQPAMDMARVRRADVVLFDLDGTLVDSAPDMAEATNEMLRERGLPALPAATLRPMVGSGARGMLGVAFARKPGDDDYEALKAEFLERYARRMLDLTRVFADVDPVLRQLESSGLAWGVVTNKAMHLAQRLITGLDLAHRAAVLVGGDTTPHAKPHPAPLLEAARRIQADPARCVYVGDDPRDVQAGRAAGMATLAAAWGYLGADTAVHTWGASAVIDSPDGLLKWLPMP